MCSEPRYRWCSPVAEALPRAHHHDSRTVSSGEGIMTMCGSCSGSGKVTCPGGGGKGNKTRITMNGDVETLPCLVCSGNKRVRCNICQGTGQIGAPSGGGTSAPRKWKSNEDVLAGRWNTK